MHPPEFPFLLLDEENCSCVSLTQSAVEEISKNHLALQIAHKVNSEKKYKR